MVLMPERTKWRKHHRGRLKGKAQRGCNVDFGEYGLVAQEPAWITGQQIEAARVAMGRALEGEGSYWIRIFPDKPYTQQPLETRMGKGKGSVESYVCPVRPGRVLFEVAADEELARESLRRAGMKLPIKCKFVYREPF